MKKSYLVFLSILFELSQCRDFYVGMFKKNDFLVAQDTVYKEKSPFGYTTAKYGRAFHCPITYFRVTDRLGYGRPPNVIVTRGGLRKKYITLRITAAYNTPIAVNVYVGCENNLPPKPKTTTPKEENEAEDATEGATEEPNEEGTGEGNAEGAITEAAGKEDEPKAEGEEAPDEKPPTE